MKTEGPQLESLLRRLVETPPEFLETCAVSGGAKQVSAILLDLLRDLSKDKVQTATSQETFFQELANLDNSVGPRFWGLLAVVAWLLGDDWFRNSSDGGSLARWIMGDSRLRRLADLIEPAQLLTDPDRREELVRLCLSAGGLRPAGESESQASDRLATLDSVERERILKATALAEKRAREVREAMARKKALESASRYGE